MSRRQPPHQRRPCGEHVHRHGRELPRSQLRRAGREAPSGTGSSHSSPASWTCSRSTPRRDGSSTSPACCRRGAGARTARTPDRFSTEIRLAPGGRAQFLDKPNGANGSNGQAAQAASAEDARSLGRDAGRSGFGHSVLDSSEPSAPLGAGSRFPRRGLAPLFVHGGPVPTFSLPSRAESVRLARGRFAVCEREFPYSPPCPSAHRGFRP